MTKEEQEMDYFGTTTTGIQILFAMLCYKSVCVYLKGVHSLSQFILNKKLVTSYSL